MVKLQSRSLDALTDLAEALKAVTESGADVQVFVFVQSVAPGSADTPQPRLREIHKKALKAAPGPADKPVTVKKLASLAGYQCSSTFRAAVNLLIELDFLARIPGGVRKSR